MYNICYKALRIIDVARDLGPNPDFTWARKWKPKEGEKFTELTQLVSGKARDSVLLTFCPTSVLAHSTQSGYCGQVPACCQLSKEVWVNILSPQITCTKSD